MASRSKAMHHHMYECSRWTKASYSFRASNPWCVECESVGVIKAAEVVDHVIPHKGDVVLFWDSRNWQSLCKACHDAKTARGE